MRSVIAWFALLLVPTAVVAQPPTETGPPEATEEPPPGDAPVVPDDATSSEITGENAGEATPPSEPERDYAVYVLCAEDEERCATPEAQACNASLAELREVLVRADAAAGDGSHGDLFEPGSIRPAGTVLTAEEQSVHELLTDPCAALALHQDDAGWTVALALGSPELWEPLAPDTTTSVGSGAQATAVGSIVPTSDFGYTANYANANGISYLVAAASINPLGLLTDLPWASRAFDVSAVVPVQLGADMMTPVGVDSFGVRLRSDLVGAIRAALSEGDTGRLAREVRLLSEADAVLSAPSPACLEDLLSGTVDRCGEPGRALLERAQALADALGERRRDLDLGYGGLDVRYDHGDPELVGNLPADSNSFFLAAVGGFRFQSPTFLIGARGRVGYRYLELMGATRNHVEYGAALEVGVIIERRAVRASVSLDGFHTRDAAAADPQVDRGTLRAGVSAPLFGDTSVTLGIVYPFGDGATNQVAVVTGFEGTVAAP